ncbi:hypothetical protein [Streptomyces sp. NPDC018833]|uniref:hypothetical protein n=1 Tax=Streptomyces sp. NPDC018833 TaxID=3365053 RepID=UPI00379CDF65
MANSAMPTGASTRPPYPGDSDPHPDEALRRARAQDARDYAEAQAQRQVQDHRRDVDLCGPQIRGAR